MSSHHEPSAAEGQHYKHEGPKNHYLTYIFSILLTMFAFAAVIYGELETWFVLFFIVGLAIIQAFVQLVYWMHMKDRGHTFPILGMILGVVIVIPIIIAALYWMWW